MKLVFAVLVGRFQRDTERMAYGLPKPTQMESLVTTVFLVILSLVYSKPVKFFSSILYRKNLAMMELRVQEKSENY